MVKSKQLFALLILILVTLLLRDLPYANVVFISRLWLVYFAILMFAILASLKFRVAVLWHMTIALFVMVFVLTLMRLPFFAESVGVLIYFFLWIIVIYRLIGFTKDRR